MGASGKTLAPLPVQQNVQAGWKPMTLRWQFFTCVVAFCIALIAALQVLDITQQRYGGLHFAPTLNGFSTGATIAYLFVPTVVSALFGLIWAWVDLDAKRLEPYFQLSQPGGASGEKTVFLDYATDFIAMVPIRAFRLRHWPVFIAGINMVFVFWALTPISGAIFSIDTVTRTMPVSVYPSTQFLPIDQQTGKLHGNIFNMAYAILWRNASLPAFTTLDSALAPIDVAANLDGLDTGNGSIVAPTTRFFTNLTCVPATPTDSSGCDTAFDAYLPSEFYFIGNGGGCKVPVSGWYQVATSDLKYGPRQQYMWSDKSCPCPAQSQHIFVAHYQPKVPYNSSSQDHQEHIKQVGSASTDLFCTPGYFMQDVNATVRKSDSSVSGVVPLGDARPMLPGLFNTTNFEFVISNVSRFSSHNAVGGMADPSNSADDSDIFDTLVPDSFARLQQRYPDVNFDQNADLSVYAFTNNTPTFDAYSSPDAFAAAWQSAHQILFSLAVSVTLQLANATKPTVQGSYVSSQGAIIMNSIFTRLAQAFLGVIALLSLALLFIYQRRPSRLQRDPACLAAILRNVSPALCDRINNLREGTIDKSHLAKSTTFQLGPASRIQIYTENIRPFFAKALSQTTIADKAARKKAYPKALRGLSQAAMLSILVGALVFLTILYIRISPLQGFVLSTASDFTNHIVLDYIPIAFSTLLEPFWVMLGRDLSFLQPFDALSAGKAPAERTLLATYTSKPPQFTMFRATRQRHFLLALVAVNALLANVLSVAMSGLFQPQQAALRQPMTYSENSTAVLTDYTNLLNRTGTVNYLHYSEFDYMQSMDATFNEPPAYPPWANANTFFLPFAFNVSSMPTPETTILGTTPGISLNTSCSTDGGDFSGMTTKELTVTTLTNLADPGAGNCTTAMELVLQSGSRRLADDDGQPKILNALLALDADGGLGIEVDGEPERACQRNPLVAFLRADQKGVEPVLARDDSGMTVAGTLLTCRTEVHQALYDVQVDRTGSVIQATQSSPDVSLQRQLNSSVGNMYGALTAIAISYTQQDYWQNETYAGSWFNHFLVRAGYPSWTKVDSPPPDPIVAGSVVSDILSRYLTTYLALNADQLEPLPSPQPRQGYVLVTETRLFFAPYVFPVTAALLSLDIVVIILVLLFRPRRLLKEKPTNIAAIVAAASGSRFLDDMVHGIVRPEQLGKERYSYGTFLARGGEMKVGLEYARLVIDEKQPSRWS